MFNCHILRLKSILNPLNVVFPLLTLNGDDIKAGSSCGGIPVRLQIMHCRHYEFLLFAAVYGFRATTETVVAAVTNLYENNTVVVLHYQVNLAAATFVVSFDQFKAVGCQVVVCGILRLFTECNAGDAVVCHRSQRAWYAVSEPRPRQLTENPVVFIETQNAGFSVVTLIGIRL